MNFSDPDWPGQDQIPTGKLQKNDCPQIVVVKKSPKLLVLIVIVIVAFAVGFISSYAFCPRHVITAQEKPAQTTIPPPINSNKKEPIIAPQMSEKEIDRKVTERILQFLEDSSAFFHGILEIKDSEAKTVRYNKAVFRNKDGSFTDLKNSIAYPIYFYFVYKETGIGHGIMGDNQKNLFRLAWYPEKTNAPSINPKALYVLNGRRIGIGTP